MATVEGFASAQRGGNGEVLSIPVKGEGVGKGTFIVHSDVQIVRIRSDGDYAKHRQGWRWIVTHANTGRQCLWSHNRKSAIDAAKRLHALPVDWNFMDFTTPKTWPQDVRDQIKKIREIAAFGECK